MTWCSRVHSHDPAGVLEEGRGGEHRAFSGIERHGTSRLLPRLGNSRLCVHVIVALLVEWIIKLMADRRQGST